uniref:Putative lipocalin-5 1 n=1 Tax=Amblyomma cajennense TaxID=34607 RepID=A0A023FUB8_AMBCJ
MKLVLFFVLLGWAFSTFSTGTPGDATEERKRPDWANERRFGNYQDAWKALNQSYSTKYWLVLSTFNDDGGSWGKNFTCLSVQETELNETDKSAVSVFTFRNLTSNTTWFTVKEKVQAVFTYNYTKKQNAFQYTLENGTQINDTLIFSDGETCDIFSVPSMNGGKGCELWVNEKYVDNVPKCCLFIYNYFCTTQGMKRHYIYKRKACRNTGQMIFDMPYTC